MSDDYSQFEKRKQDHIDFVLMQANQTNELNTFDGVGLIHEVLPGLDFNEIAIMGNRFGQRVDKPFMVASMIASHRDSSNINRHLIIHRYGTSCS